MSKATIKTVGMVGLGKMGLPMTRLLLGRGYPVAAHDLNPEALAAAGKLGATPCASPAEVARASELTLVVVGFDAEARQVVLGGDGLLAGAAAGSIIAIASTVEPDTSQALGRSAEERGVRCLDIPLCRGEPAAERGELLIMGGGDEAAFEACREVFAAFASDVFWLGPLGAGQVGKMINNLLLWACIAADYEGLKLGEKLGVAPETLRQALLKSSGSNWALETWAMPRAMPWAEKDLTIVARAADRLRLPLPLCGVVKEVIKAIKTEFDIPTPRPPE